jgi:predicted nucleic acid-binding protein
MRVLDTTFLIDYLDGVAATKEFYESHGGSEEHWVIPVPAYAEVLVGMGNLPNGDVAGARADLSWAEPYAVDAELAASAADIAAEIPPGGPSLDGPDALIAAVGRQLDAPVVSDDGDLTHPETKQLIAVEEY